MQRGDHPAGLGHLVRIRPRRADRIASRSGSSTARDAIVRHLRDGAGARAVLAHLGRAERPGATGFTGGYRVRFVAPKDSLENPFCVRANARSAPVQTPPG
jgi:hypothetical protein